jgi:hypothetical protein
MLMIQSSRVCIFRCTVDVDVDSEKKLLLPVWVDVKYVCPKDNFPKNLIEGR